jgi:hypothetical protein
MLAGARKNRGIDSTSWGVVTRANSRSPFDKLRAGPRLRKIIQKANDLAALGMTGGEGIVEITPALEW